VPLHSVQPLKKGDNLAQTSQAENAMPGFVLLNVYEEQVSVVVFPAAGAGQKMVQVSAGTAAVLGFLPAVALAKH